MRGPHCAYGVLGIPYGEVQNSYDGKPVDLDNCDAQIGTKIMSKWILTTPLILMTMMELMVNSVGKWRM